MYSLHTECSLDNGYAIPDVYVDPPHQYDSVFANHANIDEPDFDAMLHSIVTDDALNLFGWDEMSATMHQQMQDSVPNNPLCADVDASAATISAELHQIISTANRLPNGKAKNMIAQIGESKLGEQESLVKLTQRGGLMKIKGPTLAQRGGLLKYQILVNNNFSVVMIDCGATLDFISLSVAQSLGLKLEPADSKLSVKLADGSSISSSYIVKNVCLQMGDYVEMRTLRVLPMNNIQIILGKPWLYDTNPVIDWKTHTMEFLNKGHRHVIHPTTCLSIEESVHLIQHHQLDGADQQLVAFIQDETAPIDVQHDDVISLTLDDGSTAVICNLDSVKEMKEEEAPRDYAERAFRQFFKPGKQGKQDFPEDCYEAMIDYIKTKPALATPMDPGRPPTRIIGNAPPVEMDIQETPGSVPQCKQPYRMSPLELKELKKQLDHLLKAGYIRPSKSPYGAPVLFAPKKNGALRLCLDYRALNAQTIKDRYPLPRDTDCFDQYRGANYFTTMDALNGYWVTPISERSIHKTAIRTPMGSFEWLVMPFGLTNAPATYQRMMENILSEYLTKFVMVFIDDVCVYTKGTSTQHLTHVKLVLDALNKYQIKIKLEKCHFFMTEVEYLGHIVNGTELKPDPGKIKTIVEWPEPQTAQHIQQFIGLVGYYQKMIKGFASIAAPLTDVMSKKWTKEEKDIYFKEAQRQSFSRLKIAMTTAPVLTLPDMTKPFVVQTDASLRALGAALMQVNDNGQRQVIAFLSKKFTDPETRWPTHERELFGFVHAFKKWRHYLHGSSVTLEGDHKPLTWIKTQKTLTGKQARWLQTLEEIDYTVKYIPGKQLVVPDAISRRPDLMTDSNTVSFLSYLMATAPEQLDNDLHHQPYLGCTAQQLALDTVMKAPAGADVTHALTLLALGEQLLKSPEEIDNAWVKLDPEVDTRIADVLPSNNHYDSTKSVITLQQWFSSTINAYIEDAFAQRIMQGETVPHYHQENGMIYYKDPALEFPVLYIPPKAIELQHAIIKESHDSPLSGHLSTEKTLERVQRFFHWPGMRDTITAYVKSCTPCQRSKRRTVKVSGSNIPYPIADHPWEVVALDMKTGLPMTVRGHDAAWVFVDRLTRRGHVISCSKKITAQELARLFFDEVIRLHGVPRVIISDQDPRFTSMFWRELWRLVGTRLNVSTADHAATDGGSERYIGTISGMLRTYCNDNPNDWDLYLAAVEFAYNDAVHPATGYTPFQLDMGRDPSTPMQFLMHGVISRPALYKQHESGTLDPSLYLQRFTSHLHTARQQLRQSQLKQWKYLQQKTTLPILYEPGEYVWFQAFETRDKDKISTLAPRYEGPYRVIRRVSPNTYQVDFGREHPRRHATVNEEKLKPYLNRETRLPYPTLGAPSQSQVDDLPDARYPVMQNDALPLPDSENYSRQPSETPPVESGIPPESEKSQSIVDPPPITIGDDIITATPSKERVPLKQYSRCKQCEKGKKGLPYCISRGHQPIIHTKEDIGRRPRLPPARIIAHHVRVEIDSDGDKIRHADLLVEQLGKQTWQPLQQVIQDGYWKVCKPYLQAMQPPEEHPLFKMVTVKHRQRGIDAVCTSYEEGEPDDKPYRLTHADGDVEDVTAQQLSDAAQQHGELHHLHVLQQHIRRPIRILDLYSGTKSVGKAVRALFPNAVIITVDCNAKFGATHTEDIVQWDPLTIYKKGYFDFIWASPPCTEYSNSKTQGERDMHTADQRVAAAIRIITTMQPKAWVIENPVGLLAKRPLMQQYENLKHVCTYCCYGMPYRKATNIWTNSPTVLKNCFDMPCHQKLTTNRHTHTAQHGPHTFADGTVAKGAGSQHALYAVPPRLIQHIITSTFTRVPTFNSPKKRQQ